MQNTLEVEEMTYNTITVTWDVDHFSGNAATSCPFSLNVDGNSLIFSLIVNIKSGCVTIRQSTPNKTGRGIVTLLLKRSDGKSMPCTCVTENWNQDCCLSGVDMKGFLTLTIPNDLFESYLGLVIKCKIIWLGLVNQNDNSKSPYSPLSTSKLPFDHEKLPDCKIIIEDKEIPIHKSYLFRHSPVILKMFENPMKESRENEIPIGDIGYDTMKILIKLIYIGDTKDLDDLDTALEILAIAEKYEMLMIKSVCECKLQMKLNRDNVLMLLDEAEKYNANELCTTCIEYIIAKKDIVPVEEFKEMCLKRRNLAVALINTQVNKLFFIPSF